MSARDELVALLGHDRWCDFDEEVPEGCTDKFGCLVWRRADRLLASDWLANILAAERERIAQAIEAQRGQHGGMMLPHGTASDCRRCHLDAAARIARTTPQ